MTNLILIALAPALAAIAQAALFVKRISFNLLTGIVVDAEGNIYVTDYFNNREMQFPSST